MAAQDAVMQEVPAPAPVAGPASLLLVPITEAAQKPLLDKLSHELSFIWDSYVIPMRSRPGCHNWAFKK